MSYIGNDLIIRFEEDHWNDLAEKFIEINRRKAVIDWDSFIYEQYEDWLNSQEPPDMDDSWHPEDENKEPDPENRG